MYSVKKTKMPSVPHSKLRDPQPRRDRTAMLSTRGSSSLLLLNDKSAKMVDATSDFARTVRQRSCERHRKLDGLGNTVTIAIPFELLTVMFLQ